MAKNIPARRTPHRDEAEGVSAKGRPTDPLLMAAATGAAAFGLVLLAVAVAIGVSWLPFLTGYRVIGQVVAKRGHDYVRYVYQLKRQDYSREIGTPVGRATLVPVDQRTVELLVDRNDHSRSMPASQIEPLEVLPIAGLGLLFLGYAAAGGMAAWTGGAEIERLLAVLRVPQGVLICALVTLAIMSWCMPLEFRWVTAGLAMVLEAGLIAFSLWQAARMLLPKGHSSPAATVPRDEELLPTRFLLPFPAAPAVLRRAA